MISDKQIAEIKEHLEKAQNPLFYFDNDTDGLCSFLLLRRAIGRGRGVAIKSFPDLNPSYFRRVLELNPDYIFILDKPIVSEGFLKEAHEKNLPIVWIDHHEIEFPDLSDFPVVYYYNSMKSENPSSEPVTYWAYKLAREEDLWLAIAGCIGDGYLPEFSKEAEKKYPGLWKPVKSAFQGLYNTELGKISRILNYSLKDRTSNVIKMIKFMFKSKPDDVLSGFLLERFKQIDEKAEKLIEKAIQQATQEKLLYFQYGGDLSISSDIANELFYKFPEKTIAVAYIKGTKANISIRGKENIKEATLKSIEGIENARGGGHKQAVGAQMNVEDLPKFIENFRKLIN